jgi:autotransporter-associated beta strand protein
LILNSNSWAGPITLNGSCNVQGYHLNLYNDGLTLSGAIGGSGSLRKTGDGRLYLKGLAGNTFTGGLLIEEGSVFLDKDASAPALSGPLVVGDLASGEFTFAVVNQANQIPNNVPVIIRGSGILRCADGVSDVLGNVDFFGGKLYGVFTLAGNITNHNVGSSAIIEHGAILTAASHIVHCDAGADLIVNGILDGPGALIKAGPGLIELRNANTYAGMTWVQAGNLRIADGGRPGSTAGLTRVESAGQLTLNNASVTNEILTLAGVDLQDHVFRAAGTCRWKGPIVLEGDSAISAAGQTTLVLDGPISGPGGLGMLALPGIIAGTIQFAGATGNTYQGPTVLEAGNLWLNKTGSAAVPGDLTIGLPTN